MRIRPIAHNPRHLLLLAALLALPSTLLAATPIDQRRPLDANGRVDIQNLKGRIQVRAWERQEVQISGSLGEGVEALLIEGDRGHLLVKVKYPKSNGWGGSKTGPTDLQLTVPLRAELKIESVSADVDVSGVASSRLSIDSVSGDVLLAAAPRKVEVETVSGDQRLTVNSAEVKANSVSGDLVLRGRMDGEIKTETVSGDIDVVVNGERISELSASTVSGDGKFSTALAPRAEVKLESVSGDLTLVLPRDVSAQARGSSFSGSISAPQATVSKPEHGPGSSFSARYGASDGRIDIETFSGNATVRLE